MKILLAPFSTVLAGMPNPKNFPYWQEVISAMPGYEFVQIGVAHEPRIEGVHQYIVGWPFDKIRHLIDDCETWCSVDSWLPHFVRFHRLKAGVVVFGQSDPLIFGYPENVNLLKSRQYLRPFQYDTWTNAQCREDCWVTPQTVAQAIRKLAPWPEMLLTSDVPVDVSFAPRT